MAVKGKKVLILGNGFDLAHGLPTSYRDFMTFCEKVPGYLEARINIEDGKAWIRDVLKKWNFHTQIKEEMELSILNESDKNETIQFLQELNNCIQKNVWYKYFKIIEKNIKGDNWIDFECEISKVIAWIDQNTENLSEVFETWKMKRLKNYTEPLNTFLGCIEFDNYNIENNKDHFYKNTMKDLRELCFCDLEKLTRALELYLDGFVRKIKCTKLDIIAQIEPDYVMSFNYTDTYDRIYCGGKAGEKISYIHGKCNVENSIEKNNMVLGIDEYWEGIDKDIHTNFSIFKKFVQRIRKKTGTDIYKILREIESTKKKQGYDSIIYVFGHSLDKTDKDVLSSLLSYQSTAVTVYCKDKGAEGELIAKMIQLVSQETLLNKVYADPSRMEFIIQKNDDSEDNK